jgi:hypothetical protein
VWHRSSSELAMITNTRLLSNLRASAGSGCQVLPSVGFNVGE